MDEPCEEEAAFDTSVIYEDIHSFTDVTQLYKEEIKLLEEKNAQLVSENKKLSDQVKTLSDATRNLNKNFSSVYRTARAEIQRLTFQNQELQKKYDELLVRRSSVTDKKTVNEAIARIRNMKPMCMHDFEVMEADFGKIIRISDSNFTVMSSNVSYSCSVRQVTPPPQPQSPEAIAESVCQPVQEGPAEEQTYVKPRNYEEIARKDFELTANRFIQSLKSGRQENSPRKVKSSRKKRSSVSSEATTDSGLGLEHRASESGENRNRSIRDKVEKDSKKSRADDRSKRARERDIFPSHSTVESASSSSAISGLVPKQHTPFEHEPSFREVNGGRRRDGGETEQKPSGDIERPDSSVKRFSAADSKMEKAKKIESHDDQRRRRMEEPNQLVHRHDSGIGSQECTPVSGAVIEPTIAVDSLSSKIETERERPKKGVESGTKVRKRSSQGKEDGSRDALSSATVEREEREKSQKITEKEVTARRAEIEEREKSKKIIDKEVTSRRKSKEHERKNDSKQPSSRSSSTATTESVDKIKSKPGRGQTDKNTSDRSETVEKACKDVRSALRLSTVDIFQAAESSEKAESSSVKSTQKRQFRTGSAPRKEEAISVKADTEVKKATSKEQSGATSAKVTAHGLTPVEGQKAIYEEPAGGEQAPVEARRKSVETHKEKSSAIRVNGRKTSDTKNEELGGKSNSIESEQKEKENLKKQRRKIGLDDYRKKYSSERSTPDVLSTDESFSDNHSLSFGSHKELVILKAEKAAEMDISVNSAVLPQNAVLDISEQNEELTGEIEQNTPLVNVDVPSPCETPGELDGSKVAPVFEEGRYLSDEGRGRLREGALSRESSRGESSGRQESFSSTAPDEEWYQPDRSRNGQGDFGFSPPEYGSTTGLVDSVQWVEPHSSRCREDRWVDRRSYTSVRRHVSPSQDQSGGRRQDYGYYSKPRNVDSPSSSLEQRSGHHSLARDRGRPRYDSNRSSSSYEDSRPSPTKEYGRPGSSRGKDRRSGSRSRYISRGRSRDSDSRRPRDLRRSSDRSEKNSGRRDVDSSSRRNRSIDELPRPKTDYGYNAKDREYLRRSDVPKKYTQLQDSPTKVDIDSKKAVDDDEISRKRHKKEHEAAAQHDDDVNGSLELSLNEASDIGSYVERSESLGQTADDRRLDSVLQMKEGSKTERSDDLLSDRRKEACESGQDKRDLEPPSVPSIISAPAREVSLPTSDLGTSVATHEPSDEGELSDPLEVMKMQLPSPLKPPANYKIPKKSMPAGNVPIVDARVEYGDVLHHVSSEACREDVVRDSVEPALPDRDRPRSQALSRDRERYYRERSRERVERSRKRGRSHSRDRDRSRSRKRRRERTRSPSRDRAHSAAVKQLRRNRSRTPSRKESVQFKSDLERDRTRSSSREGSRSVPKRDIPLPSSRNKLRPDPVSDRRRQRSSPSSRDNPHSESARDRRRHRTRSPSRERLRVSPKGDLRHSYNASKSHSVRERDRSSPERNRPTRKDESRSAQRRSRTRSSSRGRYRSPARQSDLRGKIDRLKSSSSRRDRSPADEHQYESRRIERVPRHDESRRSTTPQFSPAVSATPEFDTETEFGEQELYRSPTPIDLY